MIAFVAFWQSNHSFFSFLLFFMVAVWAIRIGAYLLVRIGKMGKDKRFDGMRENFFRFFSFWLIQGITVGIILLPSLFFWNAHSQEISLLAFLGFFLWFFGILIEGISDFQKYQFKKDPKNKDRFIQSGLWKFSRHPNYLGEIFVWTGIFLYTIFGIDFFHAVVGIVSPLFISLLLIFFSGIPPLEKSAEKKWGQDPKYQEYKKKTGVLFPLFSFQKNIQKKKS